MRNTILFLLFLVVFNCFTISFLLAGNSKKQPNILILFADDLGYVDISSPIATQGNGSKFHQTPNIDKLANEGISFTHAYAQQNCAPSRAALLTGEYAPGNGVYNVTSLSRFSNDESKKSARIIPPKQQNLVSPSTITFAEVLHQAGYRTYMFGKVHGYGGDLDQDHGFDVDLACSKKINTIKESNYMAVQDADGKWIYENPKYNAFAVPYSQEYINQNLKSISNGNNPQQLIGTAKHFTDAITDVVINEIENVNNSQPFCMWVSFHAIHSGIVGRKDLVDKYKALKKTDLRHRDVEYAALTEQLDQSVGRIVQQLKKQGLLDNTLVIFTSDNGGVEGKHSNEPLRAGKGTFYEGGTRVPLIVRFPKIIKAGRVSEEVIHLVDYYPSLAEFAGAKLPDSSIHELNGESFLPILKGEQEHLKRASVFWHFPGYMDVRQEPNTVQVKRIGNQYYKLRYSYETDEYELYNLTTDLSETTNLLINNSDENKSIAKQMRKEMCNWLITMDPIKMKYKATGEEVGLPVEME